MSGQAGSAPVHPATAPAIAGQIVANTSLLIAVLVYMGWAYDAAFYGFFHLNPLTLDIGIVEFMLVSLSLFSPGLVVIVAILTFVSVARTRQLDRPSSARFIGGTVTNRILATDSHGRPLPVTSTDRPCAGRSQLMRIGAAVTVTAIVAASTSKYLGITTYVVLSLLGIGPLLLTWPTRAERHSRFPYALAIVLAAVCALWGASLYATQLGEHAAEQAAKDLSARTAVTIYTIQSLDLRGPGIVMNVLPKGSLYHYRYQGLRLLTMRSGVYYLLPVGWTHHSDSTYAISDNDQVRIELY